MFTWALTAGTQSGNFSVARAVLLATRESRMAGSCSAVSLVSPSVCLTGTVHDLKGPAFEKSSQRACVDFGQDHRQTPAFGAKLTDQATLRKTVPTPSYTDAQLKQALLQLARVCRQRCVGVPEATKAIMQTRERPDLLMAALAFLLSRRLLVLEWASKQVGAKVALLETCSAGRQVVENVECLRGLQSTDTGESG